MKILDRVISSENAPYVIAEISANHLGSKVRAFNLIEAAHECGADAVKFQLYTADSLTFDQGGNGFVLNDGPWAGKRLHDLYQEAHTPAEWFPDLFGCARELGIAPFSSVFDSAGVDLLERLDAGAYKISSFDIIDPTLIQRVKQTGKPVILSTGMASQDEIIEADDILGEVYPHLFLHCVSGYPTPIEQADLGGIERLRRTTQLPVGLSDHTLGCDVPIAAVAMGAVVIEKHLTMRRVDRGPDAAFSLEPHEFKEMVQRVRAIHAACRTAGKPSEESSRALRKSLFWARPVAAGSVVQEQDVRVCRPALGLHPRFYASVVGQPARHDLTAGSPVAWEDLAG